ncbi:HIRA-interacting protein 3 [Merluccius polli]|uniref:HIRA-interacting protein 3 n=1 Tax=Merluccius polli TaxID=89951 RepID=A0AA47P9Q2_MERPO|nr:HIRA-interacting protein 3 [Merluccius polli]
MYFYTEYIYTKYFYTEYFYSMYFYTEYFYTDMYFYTEYIYTKYFYTEYFYSMYFYTEYIYTKYFYTEYFYTEYFYTDKPGSGKQQTKVSSDKEKESSSSLSDEESEEDKDSKKENTFKQDGPSLEDDKDGWEDALAKKLTKEKGDKKKRKEDDSKKEKEDEKAVLRLKRYISLCGVKRNYKKLLEGCRTIRSKVAVLKKELEDLGIQGQPSIEKCKKARLKREEAQELAELDVSNIITTQGRPKRRGASAWQEPQASLAARYKRTVDSDSEEGSPTGRGPKRSTDWGHLHGIISDDGDSKGTYTTRPFYLERAVPTDSEGGPGTLRPPHDAGSVFLLCKGPICNSVFDLKSLNVGFGDLLVPLKDSSDHLQFFSGPVFPQLVLMRAGSSRVRMSSMPFSWTTHSYLRQSSRGTDTRSRSTLTWKVPSGLGRTSPWSTCS